MQNYFTDQKVIFFYLSSLRVWKAAEVCTNVLEGHSDGVAFFWCHQIKRYKIQVDYLKSASSLLETSILNVAPESDLSGLNLFYDF